MLKKIPNRFLSISEPNPSWFGNPPNEPKNPTWTNNNWLKSRFHFSFAEYHNPRNMGFGVIRVLNDDLVQPKRGFGEHPHANMEICTYIVDGSLTHKDSMGTEETLHRGDIQFMTAGRGVEHQEHNLSELDPLRFLQIWINTRQQNLKPNYGSGSCPPSSRLNRWSHMVSDVQDTSAETVIKVQQDVNIYATEVEPGNSVDIAIGPGRQGYLVCIEGTAVVSSSGPTLPTENETLERYDAAELYGESVLTISAPDGGERIHMLLIEMKFTGKGRSDL